LSCSHAYMYYSSNWFASSSPLHSSLLHFPWCSSQFKISVFISVQWDINLIEDFGFLPLPYPSLAQLPLSVTQSQNIAVFVLVLQSTYWGEYRVSGLLSLANFT
jgi:hypothetical protein